MTWYVFSVLTSDGRPQVSKRPVGRVSADTYDEAVDRAMTTFGIQVVVLDRQMHIAAIRARRLETIAKSPGCQKVLNGVGWLCGKESRAYWGASKVLCLFRAVFA